MVRQIKIAKVNQVQPGQTKLFRVNGHEIALFNVEGKYYAIANSCTHSRGPLIEGRFVGSTVTCPWHGAKFDVTTGTCLEGPAVPNVTTFPVHVENGSIFVEAP